MNAILVAGALATKALVAGPGTAAVADKLRIISITATWQWAEIQAAIDGGLEFGVSHGDYSAAEVEECLEASGSIDLGDKFAIEKSSRLVRTIGSMGGPTAGGTGAEAAFNDGKPVKTRLNWLLSAGDTLNIWARNGSGVVWTTGSSLVMIGDLWVKD